MTEKLARRGLRVPSGYEPDLLRSTLVAQAMQTKVVTIACGTTVDCAREIAEGAGHAAYPVLDGDGRCVAMLGRDDLLAAAANGTVPIDDIAHDVVTIGPRDNLLGALERFVEEDAAHLPVVDTDGRLVGIVTRTDLLRIEARSSRPNGDRGAAPCGATTVRRSATRARRGAPRRRRSSRRSSGPARTAPGRGARFRPVPRDRRARTRAARCARGSVRSPAPRRSSSSIASLSLPLSASVPANTIRPSVTSAADGDASRSSSQSVSTSRRRPSARRQSMSTGCCSVDPLKSANAARSSAAAA